MSPRRFVSTALRGADQRGLALLSVLFLTLGLIVAAATAFLAVFFDWRSTDNLAAGDDALYVAEAGLAHLGSLLEPAPDFATALAWPGGEPPQSLSAPFAAPPRSVRTRVAPGGGGVLVATIEGRSFREARRRIEGTFVREPAFRPAAALLLSAGVTDVAVRGTLRAEGADREGERPTRPGIAAESRGVAALARGSGIAAASAGATGLGDAAARLRSSADRSVAGPHGGGAWGVASPEVVRMVDEATVAGTVTARGIVVADAPLRVAGRLEVEGLLLATAGVEVSGELVVRGALWAGERLSVSPDGRLDVEYSSAADDTAARLRPTELPRAAILGGWRELW